MKPIYKKWGPIGLMGLVFLGIAIYKGYDYQPHSPQNLVMTYDSKHVLIGEFADPKLCNKAYAEFKESNPTFEAHCVDTK